MKFLSTLFAFFLTITVCAQEIKSGKLLYNLRSNAPIEILNLSYKGKPYIFGETIDGDTDWPKHITFDIKNISDANFTYISFDLELPIPDMDGNVISSSFNSLGLYPFKETVSPITILKSGEIAHIFTTDEIFNQLKLMMKSFKIKDISQCTLMIRRVFFNNDTAWAQERILVKDPLSRTGWKLRDIPKNHN